MSLAEVRRILHLKNFHGATDLNAKPDAITFSIALALIYNSISKTTRRQITKGWRQGRQDKKNVNNRTTDEYVDFFAGRCMNIDYSKHQFIDCTTRCPYSENRSKLVEMAGTCRCWRECVQHIDLPCPMRTESYLCKGISNLSGCISK